LREKISYKPISSPSASSSPETAQAAPWRRFLPLLPVLLAALAILPRFAYLNVPFERDEGAYAYVADIIHGGGLPYLDAFDHKPPLVYYIYNAAFRLFGHSIRAPRLMAALFILFGCLFAFRIVRRTTGSLTAGVLTMFLLGLTTATPAYQGFGSNTEIFMVPFLLGGFCLLLEDPAQAYFPVVAGLMFGTAFAIKQVAAPFALAGGVIIFLTHRKAPGRTARAELGFAAGCALPILLFALYFRAKGAYIPFWEGFYKYNAGYVEGFTLKELSGLFASSMKVKLAADPVPWAAGLAGFALFFSRKGLPGKLPHFLFLAAGVAAVAMPCYFYSHYFLVFMPFLVIGAGLGAGLFTEKRTRLAAELSLSVAVLAAAGTQVKYFRMPAAALLADQYANNPFYQSVSLAAYLKAGAGRDGTVYIIGSEAQLLDYSGLRSPGRFFYFYPLMSTSSLRESFRAETLSALERGMPEYAVFVNGVTSTLIKPPLDRVFLPRLFRLFADYELVALSPPGSSSVTEGAAIFRNLTALTSPVAMLVFRKPGRRPLVTGVTFAQLLPL
jgi:hypothetical protein